MQGRAVRLLMAGFFVGVPVFGQDARDKAPSPATARQAAAVLDLSTFPMVDPDGEPNARVIASQNYSAKGKLLDVARKVRAQLLAAGFRELDGASFAEPYANATYQRAGFLVSLSVSPGNKPDVVSVSLKNHGNLNLQAIPVPAGSKLLYSLPVAIAYVSDLSVEEAGKACRRLLEAQGWEPFGETTVSFFVKKNAVRLQVMVNPAPAQGGKTAIQLVPEQLSADLPAPADAESLQYADSTGGMLFDSRKSQAELIAYFKEVLKGATWEATTENPIRIDFRDHLIFRNPGKELIEIQFYPVDEKIRVDLRYQSAAQVEAAAEAEGKE